MKSCLLAATALLVLSSPAFADGATLDGATLDGAALDGAALDAAFAAINGALAKIIFFDLYPGEAVVPFIVAWLGCAAVFLTLRFGFVNLRMMRHALRVLRGRYRTADDQGEVTSFQALSTALSATVGLGNIAGVAIAISIGGPGATLWMMVAGFLGMTTKFTEASLAQMYREVRPDGKLMGGAMEYLSRGLAEKGAPALGRFLAGMFALFTILGSLGAGSAFQVSQSLGAVQTQIPFFRDAPIAYGLLMAIAIGLVIIGGLRRIAHVAQAVVPLMVVVYLGACLWVIGTNAALVPAAIGEIVGGAFSPQAVAGGVIGVIVQGFKRAAFSSEAGLGSAAIAHSAASVKYPVRQGLVALYEPFIDTVVICTMTALVIVITGVHAAPEYEPLRAASQGASLTAAAFGTVSAVLPAILALCVVLFAYSTAIGWSYYGERCWTYLFGERYSVLYKLIFIGFVLIASIASASQLVDFTDLLVLAMAFPNLIGLYVLHGKVRSALQVYEAKLASGELDAEAGQAAHRPAVAGRHHTG